MRIALITRRFDPAGGGTERDLIVTAEWLRAGGHDVTIFAEDVRGGNSEWKLRRVGGFAPGRALSLLRFAYAAAPAARRDGAELLLSFARVIGADLLRSGGNAHVSYLRAARKWRSAMAVALMRMRPYHRVQMLVERRGFASPALRKVIAVSNLVKDDIVREFAVDPQKILTLFNGVDLERFRPATSDDDRAAVRAQFKIPGDVPLVIFVGNGFARKGLPFMLEAWPLLKRRAHLLVVGNDRDIAGYRKCASELRIDQQIVFAGAQPNAARLMHAADALALPSLFEPFGNVIVEAMASGLPVMSSVYCGASEVLPASMRPFCLEDPTDAGEIALRLDMLLDAAPTLREEARAAAAEFTWERYGAELNAIVATMR
ncbi:MAG TPA: glycosyltransferase family 4 protein [Candidatus Binataceae bacterium]|nr:glycosyltransferase family 4 protein [Candidatus Binataceae bacterium]